MEYDTRQCFLDSAEALVVAAAINPVSDCGTGCAAVDGRLGTAACWPGRMKDQGKAIDRFGLMAGDKTFK
jgi:hypothetical protein